MAAVAKFKVAKLPGPEIPDPGGLALMLTMRLPTGDRENLRGLGVYSHAGLGGLLRRERAVQAARDRRLRVLEQERRHPDRQRHRRAHQGPPSGAARRRLRDRGRTESHLAPRLHRAEDPEWRRGRASSPIPVPANAGGISAVQSLVVLPEGILKGMLVPGIKVNLKGKLLLSLNALVTMKNNGLHSKVTPVVGPQPDACSYAKAAARLIAARRRRLSEQDAVRSGRREDHAKPRPRRRLSPVTTTTIAIPTKAEFNFSPVTPEELQVVNFNGSSSSRPGAGPRPSSATAGTSATATRRRPA